MRLRSTPRPRWWVTGPRHAPRLARVFAPEVVEWCYLGTDVERRARVAKALGPARWVPIGEDVTQLAYDLKQPFLDWLSGIGRRQPDPVIWWGSALASRSPLQTDLFLLVCYAELVHRWLDGPAPSASRMIVVEDPWLVLMLRRWYARDGRVTFRGWPVLRCLRHAASRLVAAPLTAARTFLWALKVILISRRWFPEAEADGRDVGQRVLLYSWIEERCFASPGVLMDPWTGRLCDVLAARGERLQRLTAFEFPPHFLEALKPFATQLVVTPRYLRLVDAVRAVACWFHVSGFRQACQFLGRDYAPLLLREELREMGDGPFWRYRLMYLAMRQVAKRLGQTVKCVIYPFENQPWEKLLCLAWRREAPHVKLIGYQHSWVPPLLLSYSLGRGEREFQPLPDWIVANSAFNLRLLRDGGYAVERLVNGGALRHEYLHLDSPVPPPDPGNSAGSQRGRVVLVTFPLLAPQANSLFTNLLREFQRPLILTEGDGRPVEFILKCHPQLPADHFHGRRVQLPEWMRFSQESLRTLLPGTDVLLYIGPTSSWWEALLSGVPVLKYQADLLDIDAGPPVNGWSVQTCSRQTLRASVASVLRAGRPQVRPDGRVVEELFGRVNEAVWGAVIAEGASAPQHVLGLIG